MKRSGCDIYGYPKYEPDEQTYIIQTEDRRISVLITAQSEKDAGRQFMDMLESAMEDGIYIRKVQ